MTKFAKKLTITIGRMQFSGVDKMNSEKDKLSRSDVSQISPVSAQTQQSTENNSAPPVPKRRRHYYTAFPGGIAPEVLAASDESKPEETKTEETKNEEKKPEETKSEEKKSEETKPEEKKPEEKKPEEKKSEERKPEETKSEEKKSEEKKSEEKKPEETKSEEKKPEEKKPEETKSEETKPEDKKLDDKKSAMQKSAAQKPANQVPAKQKPANQVSAKQKPANQVPAKQKPANQVSAKQKPANQVSAKQKPANQISAKQLSEDFRPAGYIEPEDTSGYDDYSEDYNPDQPNKKAMTAAVAVASVIAAAVLGFLIFLIISNTIGKEQDTVSTADSAVETTAEATTQPKTSKAATKTVMPDLSGMSESEAYRILNDAGIKYKVARVFSESVAFNRVVSQFPVSGTEVSLSEEATLYLSKGKENEIIGSATKPYSADSTEPKTTEQKSSALSYEGDYILSDSASRKLTLSDIKDLDRETLNLALNEIFARHGRKFTDPDINDYFKSKSWYSGTIASRDFDMSILNQYETYNVNFISNYQTEKGYR